MVDGQRSSGPVLPSHPAYTFVTVRRPGVPPHVYTPFAVIRHDRDLRDTNLP
jgi:hypothetical protein